MMDKVQVFAAKISNQRHLIALRDGMASVMPLIIIGSIFMLIGNLIEQQFMSVGDWHFGSAISIFMMIVILISMALMNKFSDDSGKEGGGLLL